MMVGLRSGLLSGAASTRVGTEIGAGQPRKAAVAFKTAIACELGIMCVVVTFGSALSTAWTRVFTHDPVVSPVCLPL